MKLHGFIFSIPEGRETSGGYVELSHNTQYTLSLSNENGVRCDVEVFIDGGSVGVWRINSGQTIHIERPVHDTGRFTFYRTGTPEAKKSNIAHSNLTGLLQAVFKPEWQHRERPIGCAAPEPFDEGGTGLSGRSDQEFISVSTLDYNEDAFIAIHLRLVCPSNEPRPLFPRSTPVPPPVGQ